MALVGSVSGSSANSWITGITGSLIVARPGGIEGAVPQNHTFGYMNLGAAAIGDDVNVFLSGAYNSKACTSGSKAFGAVAVGGDLVVSGAMAFEQVGSIPTTVNDKLYNRDGRLFWNGILMASGTISAGAAGSDTQVQYNDGGSTLAGAPDLTFNKTTGDTTVGGSTGDAKIFFRDAGNYIYSNADGDFDIINADGTSTDSIKIDCQAGGLTLDGHTGVDIDASNSGKVSIDGAGGIDIGVAADVTIDIDSAALDIDSSGAITIDGTSTFSIDGVGTSNITTNGTLILSGSTGAQLSSHGGEIDITATQGQIDINANGTGGGTSGVIDIDAAGGLYLDSATAIYIGNAADKPIYIDSTAFDIDATSTVKIDAVGTSNLTTNGLMTISGSTGLNLRADSGEIDLTTRVGNIDINATAGGVTVDAATSIDLTSTEDSATSISLTGYGMTFAGGDEDDSFLFNNSPISLEQISAPSSTTDKLYNVGGTLTWAGSAVDTGGGGSPGGSDTQLQFNDGSSFGGMPNLTYTTSTGILLLTGSSKLNWRDTGIYAYSKQDGQFDIVSDSYVGITGSGNVASAVGILASAGGIDIDAVGAAGEDINITNTGGSIHITATEDAANAISLTSDNIYFTGGDQDNAYLFYSKPLHLEILSSNPTASPAGKLWSSAGYVLNWGGTGLRITGSGHFNATGADYDFQVESQNKTHAIFVDASTDQVLILSGGAQSDTPGDAQAYTDTNFFVSGALASRGTSTKGTSVFGGDLVVSGALSVSTPGVGQDVIFYGEDSDAIGLQWDADSDEHGKLILGQDNHGVNFQVYGESSNNYINWDQSADTFYIYVPNGNLYTKGDMVFDISSQGWDFTVNSNSRVGIFVDGSEDQVYILSGGDGTGPTSPNPANATDMAFFVSGTVESKGSSTKGTSLFGGDLVVSGGLYLEERLEPGTIADGTVVVYGKDDSGVTKLYFKNEDGETEIGAGGGGGGNTLNAAYDQGGAGVGAKITVDNQPVQMEVAGTLGDGATAMAVTGSALFGSSSIEFVANSKNRLPPLPGEDTSFFVSGAISHSGSADNPDMVQPTGRGKAVFGGDLVVSGAFPRTQTMLWAARVNYDVGTNTQAYWYHPISTYGWQYYSWTAMVLTTGISENEPDAPPPTEMDYSYEYRGMQYAQFDATVTNWSWTVGPYGTSYQDIHGGQYVAAITHCRGPVTGALQANELPTLKQIGDNSISYVLYDYRELSMQITSSCNYKVNKGDFIMPFTRRFYYDAAGTTWGTGAEYATISFNVTLTERFDGPVTIYE